MRSARSIPVALRRELLVPGALCAYCGGYADVIDHIEPVSRGGTCDRENLTPACGECNAQKSDQYPDEWQAWREERGLSWPPPLHLAEYMARWPRERVLSAYYERMSLTT